jgi:hypothetical protein
MATPTGLLVSKHDDRSAAFVFNSQAGLSHTNVNFNQWLHYHQRKQNSWPHAMLDEWHFSYAASYGTLISHRKPQLLHTKITTDVLLWEMRRNPLRAPVISISNILLSVIGSNVILYISNGLTHPSISQIISPNHSLGFYFTGMPITYLDIFLLNTRQYQNAITTYGDKLDYDWYIPDSFTTPITAAAARIYAPLLEDIKGNPWLRILWHD